MFLDSRRTLFTSHNLLHLLGFVHVLAFWISITIDTGLQRKRKRSDSMLWIKRLHQQKCQKGKATTQTTPQKSSIIQRLWADLSPSQTYVATALRPLRDWQFPPIAEVATRSPIGPGEVAEKSATDRGLRCDQISRSQVFVLAQKPGCDWFGRRQVPAKSPTSPRSVAE